MKIRHAILSTKLGSRTELEPPPAAMLPVDQLWWRLDGVEKAHARKITLLTNALQEIDREMAAFAATILDEVAVSDCGKVSTDDVFARRTLVESAQGAQSAGDGRPALAELDRRLGAKHGQAEARKAKIRVAIAAAEEQHVAGETEEHRKARREYQRLLRPRVKSAGIPIVHWRAGDELQPALPLKRATRPPSQPLFDIPWFQAPWELPQTSLPNQEQRLSNESLAVRIVRKAYYRVFGRWPRVTVLNPFWACAQPLLSAIEAAKAGGARDALAVVDAPGVLLPLTGLPGKIAHLSVAGSGWELFSRAFEPRQQFDLCVLQLNADDLLRFSELLVTLAPYMRSGGTIIGFCMNAGHPVGALTVESSKTRIAFTGSAASLRAIRNYSAAFGHIYGRRLLGVARGLLMLALNMPLVLWANRAEAVAARKGHLADPAFRTSLTIVVHQE
jgi:hypothetical protein